ncbi:MAG: DUF364 domain-containing protein [Lachnospiraceae bacterium]|nr:DUF364 domain-containing protein [Lachnospiraceae bacterium]
MNVNEITTSPSFFEELKHRFLTLLEEENILNEPVTITSKSLTPEEAIGTTNRKDFPILTGKDVMIQAECLGTAGQAFTDAPSNFTGSLKEICALDLSTDSHNRSLFIATLNAVMGHLGKADHTVHCKNDGPELCAPQVASHIHQTYGTPKILQIGYQPSLLETLSKEFPLQIVDLNPDNIGQTRYNTQIQDGSNPILLDSLCQWADLILCTGSTICNGTITNFLKYKEKTLFYGTSLAGAAPLMNLPRICFA